MEDLLKQEYSYNIFFKQSNLIKIIIDFDTLKIIDASESACTFYDYTYEGLLGLSLHDLDLELKGNIKDLINNKHDFITRHKTSSNSVKDVKIKVEQIFSLEKRYAVLVITDISNDKYIINHLVNRNREFEIVLDNLPFIAWFKNVKGEYSVANKELEKFSGHIKEEIIGHTDRDIFPKTEADKYIKSDNEILSGKKQRHFEEVKIGQTWRSEFKGPVYDNQGNLIGTAGLNEDITNRKQKELALWEAEKKEKQLLKETIELKDNFITLITHEFKTPIAIINAAIQTMELVCSNELTDKAHKYINKIKQNSYRQQKLVENLLDITRLKAGMMKLNLESIDIVELTRDITDSVSFFAKRKNLRINFKTSIENESVMIDCEKYERILLNLLSNSIKYSSPNKNINVNLSIEGFFIKLEIKDKGIGIKYDKQDLIFDKFEQINNSFSRHAEGTGIGLYLVKSFTELMGGTISLVSKEDHGSVFTILLPIIKEKATQNLKIKKENIDKAVSLELSDII